MKKLLSILLVLITLSSCNPCRYAVNRCGDVVSTSSVDSIIRTSEEKLEKMRLYAETQRVIDTVRVVELQRECSRDFGGYLDTVFAENSLSKSYAFADTSKNIIVLVLENKTKAKLPYRIEYREIITTDTVILYEKKEEKTDKLDTFKEVMSAKEGKFGIFLKWSGGIFWSFFIAFMVFFVILKLKR